MNSRLQNLILNIRIKHSTFTASHGIQTSGYNVQALECHEACADDIFMPEPAMEPTLHTMPCTSSSHVSQPVNKDKGKAKIETANTFEDPFFAADYNSCLVQPFPESCSRDASYATIENARTTPFTFETTKMANPTAESFKDETQNSLRSGSANPGTVDASPGKIACSMPAPISAAVSLEDIFETLAFENIESTITAPHDAEKEKLMLSESPDPTNVAMPTICAKTSIATSYKTQAVEDMQRKITLPHANQMTNLLVSELPDPKNGESEKQIASIASVPMSFDDMFKTRPLKDIKTRLASAHRKEKEDLVLSGLPDPKNVFQPLSPIVLKRNQARKRRVRTKSYFCFKDHQEKTQHGCRRDSKRINKQRKYY